MSRRVVDLTFPIHEGMTTFPRPWHPVVEVTVLGRHGIENRETRKIVLGTHTGTHCDAPRHFVADGGSVEKLSLETLIGPALVLDFSTAAPRQEIQRVDLERAVSGRRAERIILRFDWSRHWGTMTYYEQHPFLSSDAARWLVDQGVKLIAMDSPMPDEPFPLADKEDSPTHKILLGAEVIIVEYLCNLDQLRTDEVELIVLPLKIVGADGSPVRCVAIESVNE